jgi:predicted DCC family thiol-disulfide oxidoreductase YuxK
MTELKLSPSVEPRSAREGRIGSPAVRALVFVSTAYIALWALIALIRHNAHRTFGDYFNAPMAIFLALLLLCMAAVRNPARGAALAGHANAFAAWMARRGAFTSDAVAEAPKFALIRIAFGGFLTLRAFWMLYYLAPSDWNHLSVWGLIAAQFVASACVTAGIGTQLAFAYLICIQWTYGDWVLGTYTLGNYVAAMLSFLLIFANAGAHRSVDAVLLRRKGQLAWLVGQTYYAARVPADNTLQLAKVLTLFMYSLVCLYSLAMHLNEPAWMTGTAGPLLLTNKFMSSYASLFSDFFALGSWEVTAGRVALWAMFPWYLLLMPCVLYGGLPRAYAIVWSVLFFMLSEFVLQLGSLAHFEFLLLAAWFWRTPFIAGARSIDVFYDDRCNLCDRTIRFVQAVDWFGRVCLRPASKNGEALDALGIDRAAAMTDLYAVETVAGAPRIAKGYDFYVLLTRRILLLAPLYPLLLAGRVLGGPRLYRTIADRRIRWFGVCEIPTVKPVADGGAVQPRPAEKIGRGDPVLAAALHVLVLGCLYVASIPTPYLTSARAAASPWDRLGGAALAAMVYGVGPISVFNRTDLRMAENWFTLSTVGRDGIETLVPVLSEDGQRLSMHRSDRVYYGYTIRFRRVAIGKEGCLFEHFRPDVAYLSERARQASADGKIVYRQYHQALPDEAALLAGTYRENPTRLVCAVRF